MTTLTTGTLGKWLKYAPLIQVPCPACPKHATIWFGCAVSLARYSPPETGDMLIGYQPQALFLRATCFCTRIDLENEGVQRLADDQVKELFLKRFPQNTFVKATS